MNTPTNFFTCPSAPQLPPPGSPPSAPSRTRRWITRTLIGCGVFVFVLCVSFGIWIGRAAIAARQIRSASMDAFTHLRAREVDAAEKDLRAVSAALETVRGVLRSLVFLRAFPGSGSQLRALEDAVIAGSQTLEGVQELFAVFHAVRRAENPSYQDFTHEEKQAVVRAFANSLRSLRLARDKIDLALELRSRVPEHELLSPFRGAFEPVVTTLPLLKNALDDVIPLVEIGVALAGDSAPHRSLVLLQNADELRPGGGFIGTVGTVTFDGGDVVEFDFSDVYHIDGSVASTWNDIPPQPLRERLGVTQWFLRDANWSPDFPSSAERALDSYIREIELARKSTVLNPPQTVIAFEPGFFAALLRFTGPVTVEGKTFDAETFFDRLEYEVESEFQKHGIPAGRRKEIVEKLGMALRDRIAALPISRWPEFFSLLRASLEQKQILLYSRNADLLISLDRRGWTGRAHSTNGDFLWVVDANLAAFKTDGVMDKRVKYTLDATDPAKPIATVTLTYKNTNPNFTWRYTRYRSYTRIYLPEGSVFLSSSGAMKDDRYRTGGAVVPGTVDVFQELGKTVFGAFWSIEPGEARTLTFTHQLPSGVLEVPASDLYHLDWPKQPGSDRMQLTLDLRFPNKVRSASPPEQQEKWGDARYEYQTDSLIDRKFDVTF